VIRRILEGGESVCTRAGIPIAGGHTIDSVEPIYGLVAIGLVDPRNLKRNAGAKVGDKLILASRSAWVYIAQALKKGRLDDAGYRAMIATTTKLNTPGTRLGKLPEVHALTDVTGFGLLGHLLEIAKGSNAARAWTGNRSRCFPARSSSRAKASSPAPRHATGPATAAA
jgi:selenide,water dikinase